MISRELPPRTTKGLAVSRVLRTAAEKSKGRLSMESGSEQDSDFDGKNRPILRTPGRDRGRDPDAQPRPHRRAGLRDRPRRVPPWKAGPPGGGERPHHPHRDRRGRQLPRQLLGLQRREERDPRGTGPPERLSRESLPDDEDRRPDADGR